MKLIRDKTPDLLRGTTKTVRDKEEHILLLRSKIMEEAAEVAASTSREEMILEMGDLVEALVLLASMNNIDFNEVEAAMDEKFNERVVLKVD